MKIKNQYIYGGNQQFADKIINNSNQLTNTDRRLINLIYNNTVNDEDRKRLLECLENLKSDTVKNDVKEESKGLLKKFFESGVLEAGKQLAKEVINGGFERFI